MPPPPASVRYDNRCLAAVQNTILILLGDQYAALCLSCIVQSCIVYCNCSGLGCSGNRGYQGVSSAGLLVAKLEERLPFLSIVMPKQLQRRFAKEFAALQTNAKQRVITSPYDLHATLMHIVALTQGTTAETVRERAWGITARSLLHPLPAGRDCDDAGIPVHFCVCSKWAELSVEEEIVKQAAAAFQSVANRRLTEHDFSASKCARLELQGEVLQAHSLSGHATEVIANRKVDRHGRNSQITSKSKESSAELTIKMIVLMQARSTAEAGPTVIRKGMTFEVHMQVGDSMQVIDLMRMDRYGDDPICVQEEYPALREFCVCEH